eukprot:CAMPEP_0171327094 /NCGR_PEP_ID=MMETSP0816-20121228/117860_1 /TAXON_ID=420281 /ORGANISM="Proboscia inermis, Strain CCAP1064/1" /LENGTH=84 /DNA_ID=CAMNT_0011826721 /DNA_START=620 /DNA_END=874 /DNA_ORIENTATION=+
MDDNDDGDSNDDGDGDGNGNGDVDDEEQDPNDLSFFGENMPFGTQMRQIGTMANNLFVKSRWIFGGVLASRDRGLSTKTNRNLV